MKIPNYLEDIKNHLQDCNFKRDCIHCSNIIAFGVIQVENDANLKNSILFWKFLKSISNRDNPCEYSIPLKKIEKLYSWIKRSNKNILDVFRDNYLYSNAEFKSENFDFGMMKNEI